MSDEAIFAVVNYSVLPGWTLLVFLPEHTLTKRIVHSGLYVILLGVAYTLLLFGDHPGPQGADFLSHAGVTRIFTTPWTIIACWIHYLVFDLFVGSWIARDRKRLGLPHLASVPSLVLTFLFGPVGLLTWVLIRGAARKRFGTSEDER